MPLLPRRKQTPARQVTGTSYTSNPAVPLKPADYNEIGSQAGGIIRDPVPELGTKFQAKRTYAQMVRSDVSVRSSLRAGKAPVLGAEWYVDPFNEDPTNLAIAEFVDFNLFNGMTTPWLSVLEQILHFFEDGHSVFEPVWELREWAPKQTAAGANRRQYTMLRKLAVRPASTITEFQYDDNGGPVGIKQQAVDSKGNTKEVPIPIEKLVIFTFDRDGGSLEGHSILRSAYNNWYFKTYLYKIDAVQKERHGIGVPDIELQPGYSTQDKEVAHQLGRNLRTNENAYIVRNTMIKVGFAELSGNPVDALESAMHHDVQIMKNIMVQFLNAGIDTSGGGRATSATAMDMFLKAMRYIANSIAECINLWLIPQLVAYNFKTDQFPKLAVRNIGEAKDLQMWGAAMANLIQAEALVIDDATEQWIRKQVDMPKRTTPFSPPSERPGRVTETVTEQKGNGQVQTGNIGKSPSSGAV